MTNLWNNKPYVNTLESLCDACKPIKEPATTNIQQMNGTWVGLCARHYSEYLQRQKDAISQE